jgi:hypothetical protein
MERELGVPQPLRFVAAAARRDALPRDVLLRTQRRPTDAAESRAILDPESTAGK